MSSHQERYFHNSPSRKKMPLLSINSILPTTRNRGQFQRSVSLISYVFVDVDPKSNCDRSDSNLDTEYLNTAIFSQKKILKKSISLATNHDLNNNNISFDSFQPDIQKPKHHHRSKSLNEFRKVSSNELLPSYFDNVKDSLIIDVSC